MPPKYRQILNTHASLTSKSWWRVWRIPSGNLENCYLRQFRFSREDYDLKAVKNGSGWTLTRQQKPGRVAWPIPPSLLTALGSSVETCCRKYQGQQNLWYVCGFQHHSVWAHIHYIVLYADIKKWVIKNGKTRLGYHTMYYWKQSIRFTDARYIF